MGANNARNPGSSQAPWSASLKSLGPTLKGAKKRVYKIMTREAQEVLYAAIALRDERGWVFRYARDDAKYQIVDIRKMKRLEKALQRYKPIKECWS